MAERFDSVDKRVFCMFRVVNAIKKASLVRIKTSSSMRNAQSYLLIWFGPQGLGLHDVNIEVVLQS